MGSVQAAPPVGSSLETAWFLLVDLEWVYVGEWLSGVFVRVGVRACVHIGGVGARVACVCTCARACERSIGEDRQTSAALRTHEVCRTKARLACVGTTQSRADALTRPLSLCDARRVSTLK